MFIIRLISKEGENTVIRKPKITITVRKTTKKEMIQGTIVWGVLIAVLGSKNKNIKLTTIYWK